MSSTKTGDVLSRGQVEQFNEEGYVFLPGFFDDDKIERFRNEADRILELTVNSSLANNRQSRRLSLNNHDDGTQSVRNLQPFIDLSRVFKRVAVNDLPPLLRPLMDDKPVSMDRTSQLNYKQPLATPVEELDGAPFTGDYPVHADWPYFEGKAPTPTDFVIGSVFIDACTEDKGPLEVWPGTHKQKFEHEKTDLGAFAVPPDRIDHEAGQKVCGPAGSILLFDAKLIHSSEPNLTGEPRRIAVYRHAPAGNVENPIRDGSARPGGYGFPQAIIESTYENEYRRLKRRDKYEDRFTAPDA